MAGTVHQVYPDKRIQFAIEYLLIENNSSFIQLSAHCK